MDVILHLGAHRTGTTTFQAYLRRNRRALADLRIAVWEPDLLRNGFTTGLTGPDRPATPAQMRRAERSVGLIRLETERLRRAGADRLLVSEENMIGSVRDNLARTALYPEVIPRLARFSPAFAARCSRVVIGIRSYDRFWASALAYALPNGVRLPDRARLDRLVTQPRRWKQVITDIAATFPGAECMVVPFEAVAGQPEVQLAAMLGEPVPRLADARRWLHPSPSRDMLRQVLRDRGERDAAQRIPGGGGPWQPFAPEHVAAMQAQYAGDLDWLRAGADGCATLMTETGTDAGQNLPPRPGNKGRDHDRQAFAGAGLG